MLAVDLDAADRARAFRGADPFDLDRALAPRIIAGHWSPLWSVVGMQLRQSAPMTLNSMAKCGRDAALRHCREVRHSIAITAPLCWFDPGVRRPADSADRADAAPAGPR